MKALTVQRLKDQVLAGVTNTSRSSLVGNLLVALSGFILYSDKVFSFIGLQFIVPEKWATAGMDFPTFVWFCSQTVSPAIWALSTRLFKTHLLIHTVPVYCYVLQLYFIFFDFKIVDDSYLQVYVVGTTILTMLALLGIWWLLRRHVAQKIERAKKMIMENGK